MKIGIIGPTETEVNPFIDCLENVNITEHALLKFHSGFYKAIEVVVLYSGVCKVNSAIAAQILIDKFEISHLILSGVAGGIDKNLKIGDTVLGTSFGYHDVDKGILTEYHPWMKDQYFYPTDEFDNHLASIINDKKYEGTIYKGKIVTGEAFISAEGRNKIIKEHDPLCVDMETTSIAHVCYANKMPFFAIRTMTDTEEYCGNNTFEENLEMAALKSISVMKDLLDKM